MADTGNKNNADNVSVGKPMAGGALFVAPAGTALPTDASTNLGEAFKNLGYISEEGLTNEQETDSEEIKAWGGDMVANPQTSYVESYKYTLIEQNAEVFKHVYGADNVTVAEGTGAITIKHNSKEKVECVIVAEVLLSNNRVKRLVIPKGKISEVGEIAYKDDEAIGYEITLKALPDANGNSSYEYIATISE